VRVEGGYTPDRMQDAGFTIQEEIAAVAVLKQVRDMVQDRLRTLPHPGGGN
jgi:hypothetical protein